ncbi:MAG: carbohydrate ABC transporter permease [Caldibacillus sp.]
MKKRKNMMRSFIYIFLTAYSLMTLFPFLWSLMTSFKTTREITSTMTFFPQEWSFGGYKIIFDSQFPIWVKNSLVIAMIVTFLNLLFNTLAGYALARIPFKGRNFLFNALLILIMIPSQVTMIPLYIVIARMGLVNTHMALIVTSMINITYIFMMRQFFMHFPREVEEAAAIDGLSRFGTFFRIVLPNMKASIATQCVFVFMAVWNEFMRPLLFISSTEKYMLTQGLNFLSKQYMNATKWDVIMAGAILSIIPILLLYILLNKYFIRSSEQQSGIK